MKKALITLAIGKRYEGIFDNYCKTLWSHYAEVHGFDLIVHNKPLDTSDRAKSRNPAWQKCLILSDSSVQKYDQVVWVDSDILINPKAPDVTAEVPLEKIGAADEYATPTQEDYTSYLERIYESCSKQNIKCVENLTPTDFHRKYGFDGNFENAVQTGMMVLSPHHHRELLEHVYYHYEDKGPGLNLEMRPLSYEILTNNVEFWLSPKFNMIWPYMKLFVYPFFRYENNIFKKGIKKIGLDLDAHLLRKCTTAAFLNNYFLHFASTTTSDMKYVDTRVSSVYEL